VIVEKIPASVNGASVQWSRNIQGQSWLENGAGCTAGSGNDKTERGNSVFWGAGAGDGGRGGW
jgi:hypothetical protein